MSKGGSAPKIKPSPLEIESANQMRDYYNNVQKPLQGQVTPQVQAGFAENDLFGKTPDPYARDTMEKQFGQAKNQLLNSAPVRGGRLAREMTNLQSDRAMGVSGLYAQKGQEARGNLLNMLPSIFPNAGANQAGMQNLAQMDASRRTQQAGLNAQGQQSMGSGISGLLTAPLSSTGGGSGGGGSTTSLLGSMLPLAMSAFSMF